MRFKNRQSYFSKDWKILFIHESDKLYELLIPVFEIYGIAVSFLKQKLIFINYNKIKDLTNDHIYAIEAHELGHFIAGHSNKEVADIDETEADIIGINILLKNNKLKSAQFLIERLSYDNINYKEYKLSHNIWADIKQYIK